VPQGADSPVSIRVRFDAGPLGGVIEAERELQLAR
jgi:hypothetical protein